ncbi:hypothetical protein [Cysteiniphilum sp. 6C5]|uniref:hypothetical protein n=1 Tax=unclassified Cysteiniphilum TaxID=2610889 RepID=UPI003F87F685
MKRLQFILFSLVLWGYAMAEEAILDLTATIENKNAKFILTEEPIVVDIFKGTPDYEKSVAGLKTTEVSPDKQYRLVIKSTSGIGSDAMSGLQGIYLKKDGSIGAVIKSMTFLYADETTPVNIVQAMVNCQINGNEVVFGQAQEQFPCILTLEGSQLTPLMTDNGVTKMKFASADNAQAGTYSTTLELELSEVP